MGDIIIKNIKEKFNKKKLFIYMDEIIIRSINEGNLHFFITINFIEKIDKKKELEIKIKKLENIIEEIELLSWYNIVSEKNLNKNYHLHIILAIKSLIGFNNIIENNIKFYLINNYEIDSKVDILWNFIDIKKSWRYIFKDFEKKENDNLNIIKIKEDEEDDKFKNLKNIIKIRKINKNEFDFLKGVKLDEKNYNERQLIFLWEYYLILNNIVIYKEKLYKKIENTMISYEEFNKIEYMYENFSEIFFFFKKNFKIQFENFDELNFVSKFVKNKNDKITRLVEFSGKNANFNFNILEFKDGIYSILHNKFIRTNKFNKKNEINLENILIKKEIITIKFYNYSFENIQEPKMWLNSVEKVLGLKKRGNSLNDKIAKFLKEDDIKWLLIYIAYIFHYSTNELKKQNTLYIWGPSNTGKTTLIINLFIKFFKKENIGLISNNKNFEYQHLINKNLLIFDEFDINKINIDNFKKLISKELILGERKNKEPELINPTPMIISSNYNLESKLNLDENKEAILNRLKIINFSEKFEDYEMEENINKELEKEEGKIIVYCNRVYFNWIKKGKKTRTNDIKLLKKI